jgi:BON domain
MPPSDPAPTPSAENPLAERLRRAIQAHPVLRDQKKLRVEVRDGVVALEGHVFTRDMRRQLDELLWRLPGSEEVRVRVEAEISPPRPDRETEGKVPTVSPGPSNVDRGYSTAHLDRKKRRG